MKRIITALLTIALLSCSGKNEPSDPISAYGETAVYQHGDSTLFLCNHEWTNIVLSETNPNHIVAYLPWRVPTKDEAYILHQFTISTSLNQRLLCIDPDSVYYSFLFGSGNITKAGQKTKYTLRPVRLQVTNKDTIIHL